MAERTSEAQIAAIFERLDHMSNVLDELRPLAALAATLQNEQQHLSDDLRHLNTIAEMRGAALHAIDKRVTVLERWHRFMLSMPALMLTLLIAMGGYAKSYLDAMSDFKDDIRTRLTTIEFIVNSPNFERAMAPDRPVAEGGRK